MKIVVFANVHKQFLSHAFSTARHKHYTELISWIFKTSLIGWLENWKCMGMSDVLQGLNLSQTYSLRKCLGLIRPWRQQCLYKKRMPCLLLTAHFPVKILQSFLKPVAHYYCRKVEPQNQKHERKGSSVLQMSGLIYMCTCGGQHIYMIRHGHDLIED